MKILYINAVCGVGSTGRIVTDLMKQAKYNGHNVKVACSAVEPIKNADPEDIIVAGSKMDYYIHNALSRFTDHEGLYSKLSTKELLRQISEYNPDLVHLHNLHGHWINYEMLFKYLADEDKKVIWTLHDCWPFTGHCTHFSLLDCDKWKTKCTNCPGLSIYPMCYTKGDVERNYERKMRAFTSVKNMTIVTPSKWLASLVKESFLGKYEIEVINNKVNTQIFKPTPSNFREKYGLNNKIIILGVSNVWSEHKGYNDFLKLAEVLDDRYAVVLVGLTEKQIINLPGRIIGFKRTNSENELAAIYTAADVFVNLTYQDNYPTVNLEAISCGTPIVTYNTDGSVEAGDDTCCITVPQHDIQGVIKAIEDARLMSREATLARSKSYMNDNKYTDYLAFYGEFS